MPGATYAGWTNTNYDNSVPRTYIFFGDAPFLPESYKGSVPPGIEYTYDALSAYKKHYFNGNLRNVKVYDMRVNWECHSTDSCTKVNEDQVSYGRNTWHDVNCNEKKHVVCVNNYQFDETRLPSIGSS